MTDTSKPSQGEFYILQPDMRRGGPGHGVVFENLKNLLAPPRRILHPEGVGFPPLREMPRLVYDPQKGVPPQDLEGGVSGYWLVSERLKNVFQAVDPAGFEFAQCDYSLEDGSTGPSYYLCDVVRVLDALDEEASTLNIEVSDEFAEGKYYNLTGGASLVFKKDMVGNAHVFLLPYSGFVFCDGVLREAVREAGIGTDGSSDGLWFLDAADC